MDKRESYRDRFRVGKISSYNNWYNLNVLTDKFYTNNWGLSERDRYIVHMLGLPVIQGVDSVKLAGFITKNDFLIGHSIAMVDALTARGKGKEFLDKFISVYNDFSKVLLVDNPEDIRDRNNQFIVDTLDWKFMFYDILSNFDIQLRIASASNLLSTGANMFKQDRFGNYSLIRRNGDMYSMYSWIEEYCRLVKPLDRHNCKCMCKLSEDNVRYRALNEMYLRRLKYLDAIIAVLDMLLIQTDYKIEFGVGSVITDGEIYVPYIYRDKIGEYKGTSFNGVPIAKFDSVKEGLKFDCADILILGDGGEVLYKYTSAKKLDPVAVKEEVFGLLNRFPHAVAVVDDMYYTDPKFWGIDAEKFFEYINERINELKGYNSDELNELLDLNRY